MDGTKKRWEKRMNLYNTDYTKLSDDDKKLFINIESSLDIFRAKKLSSLLDTNKNVRHYRTLFPNNYLDAEDLKNEKGLKLLLEKYKKEIHKENTTETTIANWIRDNGAYFIPASILKGTHFGHHAAFVMPEFKLGNSFEVDYLIFGSGSGGYEFIFMEIEHPNCNITLKDGQIGGAFRKGLSQVQDWKMYLESNYSSLEETFTKYICPGKELPREFRHYDSSRIHYAVVAGLRGDFNDYTYRIKRDFEKEKNIKLLHYDNLYDYSHNVINQYF